MSTGKEGGERAQEDEVNGGGRRGAREWVMEEGNTREKPGWGGGEVRRNRSQWGR